MRCADAFVISSQVGSSVLAGFDFPYGYPAGLARVLGLDGSPWRSVWDDLKARIADDQTLGTNNRFYVAGDLNRYLTVSSRSARI